MFEVTARKHTAYVLYIEDNLCLCTCRGLAELLYSLLAISYFLLPLNKLGDAALNTHTHTHILWCFVDGWSDGGNYYGTWFVLQSEWVNAVSSPFTVITTRLSLSRQPVRVELPAVCLIKGFNSPFDPRQYFSILQLPCISLFYSPSCWVSSQSRIPSWYSVVKAYRTLLSPSSIFSPLNLCSV